MIQIQRLSAQGTQEMVLKTGSRLHLRTGESLVINQEGVLAQRQGSDLILVYVSDDGQKESVLIIPGFFNPNLLVQVLIQSSTQSAQVVTPTSSGVPEFQPVEVADNVLLETSLSSIVGAYLIDDLRIDDMYGNLLRTHQNHDDLSDRLLADSDEELLSFSRVDAKSRLYDFSDVAIVLPPIPGAPTLRFLDVALEFQGVPAINEKTAREGVVFSGEAEPFSRLVLTLEDSDGRSIITQVETSVDGQWQSVLSLAQWQYLNGYVRAHAYAENSVGQAGPSSVAIKLYVDAVPPVPPLAELVKRTEGDGFRSACDQPQGIASHSS